MEDQGGKPRVNRVVDQDCCLAVNQDEYKRVNKGRSKGRTTEKDQATKRTRTKVEDQGEKPSVSQVLNQDWCRAVNQDQHQDQHQDKE